MNPFKREINKIEIPKELSSRSVQGISQAKSTTLFWILFFMIGLMNLYIFAFIVDRVIPWENPVKTIVSIFVFLIVMIPLTVILSEKAAKASLKLGLEKQKNFLLFLAIIVMIPLIMLFNENREKGLDEVIQFQPKHVDFILIGHDHIRTDKEEHAKQLKELLSQYRVKKMKDSDWDADVSREKGFQITIYEKGKPIIAFVYENRVSSLNRGNYYYVLNGPINLTWFEQFFEE